MQEISPALVANLPTSNSPKKLVIISLDELNVVHNVPEPPGHFDAACLRQSPAPWSMSTQAQSSSSPFSRLSRLAFPFKPSSSSPLTPEAQQEDWYIPYHGPYEPPKDERSTDSWGHLVSGWLMENEGERPGQTPRNRAMSNASRMTADEQHRRKSSSRFQAPFIKLDQAGGVGDVPVPARPRRPQETPGHRRASFASILSFGNKKGAKLHHSPSTGSLRNDPGGPPPVPQGAVVARPEASSLSQPAFPRRHPYAYATPAVSTSAITAPPPRALAAHKFSVQLLDPLARKPSAPAYLLPSRRPSKISLKASMSTPNLRAATGTGSVLPKGKQRWLSAETWCDALILPRPRFTLRMIDGEGGSGRIVSPPSSPIWPPGMESKSEQTDSGKPGSAKPKTLKKSHSAIQLNARPPPPSPPHPFPTKEEPRAGPSNGSYPLPENANAAHLKPYRPKSWALDDLALPSPAPSLAKVLEDGRKLEEDRKAWQKSASKSFADKRAGTIARARSKSFGARTPSHARTSSAFGAITEATLLGSQKRRPTVHVRVRPPRSDGHTSSSGVGSNSVSGTGTGTGTGVGTLTSGSHAPVQDRTRSHGHSNSLGSISQSRSDESFMWTPGHGRNHSFGKSALRIVRATANTAAELCGINGMQSDDDREKVHPAFNEKAAAIEDAIRHDGTKVIHLRDQVAREQRLHEGGIVVITPPPGSATHSTGVSPGGIGGASPTPSALSTSAEGIGIAISTPPSQDDHFRKEPIRIPAHPYAQGASYPYYQRTPGRAPILTNVRPLQSQGSAASSPTNTEDGVTKHRQPIAVHPYSPYTQVQHPYAAVTGTDSGPSTSTRAPPRPNKYLDGRPSPLSSMFAELSPGTIREIMPDEIQYSPYIPTPPVRLTEFAPPSNPSSSGHPHPYGPPTKRTSEWGFADALSHTMVRRNSTDSGLGASEAHEIPAVPECPKFVHVLDDADDVLSPDQDPCAEDECNMLSAEPIASSSRPRMRREATQASSNHTLASSPMESIDPRFLQQELSVRKTSFNSSGSSPGMVSTQSSPPLSPRPLNASDDLERFQDLFYRPPGDKTPQSEGSWPSTSRRPSGSIQVELNARSTRSLSGLTTLARQLSEEIQAGENDVVLEDADSALPMWGTRYGGLSGTRPDDLGPDPPVVLSQSSSRSGYRPEGTQSPLRLPIDENLVLSQPAHTVPEDVESSRASSMLELPLEVNLDNMRVREIEAVSTPSVFAQEHRFSTHLTQMDYHHHETELETETGMSLSPIDSRHRIVSQQSSLGVGVPLSSDATRSSFMTNTSGMSRLSDFPAPPSMLAASHLSILHAYYGDDARARSRDGDSRNDGDGEEREYSRGLTREPSHATFGGHHQMGEAL